MENLPQPYVTQYCNERNISDTFTCEYLGHKDCKNLCSFSKEINGIVKATGLTKRLYIKESVLRVMQGEFRL